MVKINEGMEYSDCPFLILACMDLNKEEGCFCDLDEEPCEREKCKVISCGSPKDE